MADGTRFQIDVDVEAGSAEAAASAVDRLAQQLTHAGEASTAASAAVKAAEAAYSQAEANADRAAKAVEKLSLAIDAQKAKMAAAAQAGDEAAYARAAAAAEKLGQRQAEAAQHANAAKVALDAEAAALDRLKSAATQASERQEQLKKAHEDQVKVAEAMKKAQEKAAGSKDVKEAAEGLAKLGGPLAGIGQGAGDAVEGVNKLTTSLGAGLGIYVAAAVAIVALTAAIVAGTAAILKFAIANSDAAQTADRLAAGIAKSEVGGAELVDTIADLSKRVPQSREELRNMAADLAKTGLKGKELADALENAAVEAAELKWGPGWAQQTKSLDKLGARFKDNISDLFRLNTGPLLDGFSKLVDLLDSNSETGKTLKMLFVDFFQPLIDGLASLVPKIVSGFIQFEIWVLKALIAIKPFGSTIVAIGKVVGVAILAVVAIFAALVAIIVGVAAAAGALVTGLVWLGSKFFEVTGLAGLLWEGLKFGASVVVAVFNSIKAQVEAVINFVKGLSLSTIGTQLVEGLAQGITNAGAAVLAAMKGVVSGAINAAKSLLGIASPSKVFAQIGMQTAEGMAGGVETGSGGVSSALESMVAPPDAQVGGNAGSSDKVGGNTYRINISAPSGDAQDIRAVVREVLLDLLEGDVVELGAEVPA